MAKKVDPFDSVSQSNSLGPAFKYLWSQFSIDEIGKLDIFQEKRVLLGKE